ncbi:hypothetical protein [Xanthomonas theicola]|nr:hypothetical protein [Xanthomonas theicola]
MATSVANVSAAPKAPPPVNARKLNRSGGTFQGLSNRSSSPPSASLVAKAAATQAASASCISRVFSLNTGSDISAKINAARRDFLQSMLSQETSKMPLQDLNTSPAQEELPPINWGSRPASSVGAAEWWLAPLALPEANSAPAVSIAGQLKGGIADGLAHASGARHGGQAGQAEGDASHGTHSSVHEGTGDTVAARCIDSHQFDDCWDDEFGDVPADDLTHSPESDLESSLMSDSEWDDELSDVSADDLTHSLESNLESSLMSDSESDPESDPKSFQTRDLREYLRIYPRDLENYPEGDAAARPFAENDSGMNQESTLQSSQRSEEHIGVAQTKIPLSSMAILKHLDALRMPTNPAST